MYSFMSRLAHCITKDVKFLLFEEEYGKGNAGHIAEKKKGSKIQNFYLDAF